jgi:hypothetical protein
MYEGYWNEGEGYKCVSEDLYPIVNLIYSSEYRVKANSTFTQLFGESTPKSYTLFIIFPPSGAGTFHVKLTKAN